ncbi:hypothetical protein BV22DRAFT_1007491 [Leucogyrophana mollusca]|uniref:Uncharacterized protein n=1 Tax=Leucogyrophana mollusca TaxID=85980 RepID=A0ACB8BNP8_9AGAM|nr:hypothetical protein BV22DRAFT_1007491 [Leucogyrophana mollusca]
MAAVTLHKRPVRPLPDPPCQQLINLSASLPLLVVDASGVLGSLGEPQTLPNTICPFFCRALYDNIVHNAPSEFSFRKNDIIEVVACLESGWWGGLLDGQRGWFPSSYVTVIQPETFVKCIPSP